MKRARRDRVLSMLYADLESGDFDVREFAMFQLALMLRRSKANAPISEDYYEDERLTREQRRIRLSSGEQARIVDHLLRVASRHAESRASAFWALAEVSSEAALVPVLSVIGESGGQLSDEAANQACRALRKWLELADPGQFLLNALLAEDGPLMRLRRWSCSSDARLAKSANAVISLARELSN